ncbi:synaptotagmin-like protein 2 isoform X2 [Cebidichthys violaceus]|uniref:synaptotagmin-like protein 2 isoform X2 n=1 Tax=Cebidichthys violaceus TaxID=271503 RepID=UPI0035C99350
MIDLSYLTEEEQGAIMTVLRRDADLKKAEEERVRKLERVPDSRLQSDTELKYRTGEWFYEAKSLRHVDKIHGSEIILASMKQRRAGSDGSLRTERSKTPSSRGSDIGAPPKPARCLEALQPQEIDAEKENLNSAVRSPRPPRHNPFNRASLIVVEPPENNDDPSTGRDRETPETEPISPLKSHLAQSSQTSGASLTSEGSSVGYRPVPKKRTFRSRCASSQPESNGGTPLDALGETAGIVPSPRRSLQRGSSENSNQSYLKGQDEMPQKSVVSYQASHSAQPSKPLDENSQQPLCDVAQLSSDPSPKRERKPPSITRYRLATYTRSDASGDKEIPLKSDGRGDDVVLHTGWIQDSDPENNSSMGTAMRPGDLSLPQSTVDPDPPVSYDLNFIDKSDQLAQKKSNQKHAFQLSTQTTSPTGDEEDSIAKVLDWFSRSTDSLDWPKTEDSPKVTQSSDDQTEISKSRGEGSLREDAGDIISDRKKETLQMRRNSLRRQSSEAKELRATDRDTQETQEEVGKNTRERIRSQEVEDNTDESQPPQIAHLKSFWEKSNPGHKIIISKSITPGDKGQKPGRGSAEKDEDKVNKPHIAPDVSTGPGTYNGMGIYDRSASHPGDAREQQKDTGPSLVISTSTQRNNNDSTCNVLKLAASPPVADRRDSDTEIVSVNRISPQPKTQIPVSHRDADPDSEKLHLSRDSPYTNDKQGDQPIASKAHMRRGWSEEVQTRDSEDKSTQSSMSPKQKEDASNKDRIDSPHTNRQGQPHQESAAEKIKQLKSFWEQEWQKPPFYTGKPKPLGDGKVARGANQSKLNKRFTKSEYDLTSIGNDSGIDDGHSDRNYRNLTVLPVNQTMDKLSPTLRTSRTQFSTLREFWGEAKSDAKGSSSFDKPKSPKKKEPISGQLSFDPENYRVSEKPRPAAVKSSPPLQNRSKSPHDRQTGSRAASDGKNNLSNYATAESKRSSKDANREEKPPKSPIRSGKETRSPKSRKDSFGTSSSRGNSMRRAISMFSLSDPDEKELKMDVHSQSRKQRQNSEKGSSPRRSPEETETLTPRARAHVPRGYQHYLGMTDESSGHASLAPAAQDEASEGKSRYEFDPAGPVRTSTPVSLGESYSSGPGKSSQRPLWANYSGSDAGQESSVSSASESWSNSRSSNCENDAEGENLVRKALRRAEARPKNLTKSLEDITASLSPRQETRQDPAADMRRIRDASSIPSPSSSLFSDPEHLKKMSKSVPSFLQKEDVGRDTDSTLGDSDRTGRLTTGSSLNNLTGSSGMSSMSGSVMTVYSGDFGNVEVQGNIQFSINYVQKLREFHIFVTECQDLAAVDPKRGRSDPYVKSYLVPDKANLGKRKTSVKKKTRNPTFNEILRYRVRMEYLRTQTLILSVWHHDTFGRNSFLGEVDVDLSKWDFDHTQMNYLALKARTAPTLAPSHGQGEMRLAMRFLPEIVSSEGLIKEGPTTGEVHIWVKDCKNLPRIRASIDPYVKCFVLPDTSRKSRQKTRVVRRTADPAFNHTMVYDGIRQVDLSEACVELTVWDQDRLASNLLGGLRLGVGKGRSYGAPVDWMDSTPYEEALWERMMTTPNEWVEDVLPLRVMNSAKTGFK